VFPEKRIGIECDSDVQTARFPAARRRDRATRRFGSMTLPQRRGSLE
jgi:hypothetical protein